MIGSVPAGYIVVIADGVRLYVLASKALVLLFAVLTNAFIDSNPRREKSSVIKKKKERKG